MPKICVQCDAEFPVSKTINGKRRNLQNRSKCLDCLPFGQSNYRKKSPKERRTLNALKAKRYYHRRKKQFGIDPVRLHREKRKREIVELLGGKCQLCGYNKAIRNLVFHHLFDKSFLLSTRGLQYAMGAIIIELRKCVLICHNCHGEVHDGLVEEAKIKEAHRFVLKQLRDRNSIGRVANS